MIKIFDSGRFSSYRASVRLDDARSPIMESSQYVKRPTTVFLSHKHDELDDLKDVVGFLEKEYSVKVYIDSRDPLLPKKTSGDATVDFWDEWLKDGISVDIGTVVEALRKQLK